MPPDPPLLVSSGNFFHSLPSRGTERGSAFALLFAHIPEKGILDYIAHSSIIQTSTVLESTAVVDCPTVMSTLVFVDLSGRREGVIGKDAPSLLVIGCGKSPLTNKSLSSQSGDPSDFHVQKNHPSLSSYASSWASTLWRQFH